MGWWNSTIARKKNISNETTMWITMAIYVTYCQPNVDHHHIELTKYLWHLEGWISVFRNCFKCGPLLISCAIFDVPSVTPVCGYLWMTFWLRILCRNFHSRFCLLERISLPQYSHSFIVSAPCDTQWETWMLLSFLFQVSVRVYGLVY